MKQALLFLLLLTAGIAVLVATLGPASLFRDYERPAIAEQRVGEMPALIEVADKGFQIGASLPRSARFPITEDRILRQEDGSVRRIATNALMPTTIPSTASAERSFCASSAFRAFANISVRSINVSKQKAEAVLQPQWRFTCNQ